MGCSNGTCINPRPRDRRGDNPLQHGPAATMYHPHPTRAPRRAQIGEQSLAHILNPVDETQPIPPPSGGPYTEPWKSHEGAMPINELAQAFARTPVDEKYPSDCSSCGAKAHRPRVPRPGQPSRPGEHIPEGPPPQEMPRVWGGEPTPAPSAEPTPTLTAQETPPLTLAAREPPGQPTATASLPNQETVTNIPRLKPEFTGVGAEYCDDPRFANTELCTSPMVPPPPFVTVTEEPIPGTLARGQAATVQPTAPLWEAAPKAAPVGVYIPASPAIDQQGAVDMKTGITSVQPTQNGKAAGLLYGRGAQPIQQRMQQRIHSDVTPWSSMDECVKLYGDLPLDIRGWIDQQSANRPRNAANDGAFCTLVYRATRHHQNTERAEGRMSMRPGAFINPAGQLKGKMTPQEAQQAQQATDKLAGQYKIAAPGSAAWKQQQALADWQRQQQAERVKEKRVLPGKPGAPIVSQGISPEEFQFMALLTGLNRMVGRERELASQQRAFNRMAALGNAVTMQDFWTIRFDWAWEELNTPANLPPYSGDLNQWIRWNFDNLWAAFRQANPSLAEEAWMMWARVRPAGRSGGGGHGGGGHGGGGHPGPHPGPGGHGGGGHGHPGHGGRFHPHGGWSWGGDGGWWWEIPYPLAIDYTIPVPSLTDCTALYQQLPTAMQASIDKATMGMPRNSTNDRVFCALVKHGVDTYQGLVRPAGQPLLGQSVARPGTAKFAEQEKAGIAWEQEQKRQQEAQLVIGPMDTSPPGLSTAQVSREDTQAQEWQVQECAQRLRSLPRHQQEWLHRELQAALDRLPVMPPGEATDAAMARFVWTPEQFCGMVVNAGKLPYPEATKSGKPLVSKLRPAGAALRGLAVRPAGVAPKMGMAIKPSFVGNGKVATQVGKQVVRSPWEKSDAFYNYEGCRFVYAGLPADIQQRIDQGMTASLGPSGGPLPRADADRVFCEIIRQGIAECQRHFDALPGDWQQHVAYLLTGMKNSSLDITPENAARFCALVMQIEQMRTQVEQTQARAEQMQAQTEKPLTQTEQAVRNEQERVLAEYREEVARREEEARWGKQTKAGGALRGLAVRPAGISARLYQPSRFVTRPAGISARLYQPGRGMTRPAGVLPTNQSDCELNGNEWVGGRCQAPRMTFDVGEGEGGGQTQAQRDCLTQGGTAEECAPSSSDANASDKGTYSPPTRRERDALDWVSGIGGIVTAGLGTFLQYDLRQQAQDLATRDADFRRQLALANANRATDPNSAATIASLQAQIADNRQNASTLAAQIQSALQARDDVGMPVWGWVLLGVTGLAVVGGGMYVVMSGRRRE